jgi:hypothetical protein
MNTTTTKTIGVDLHKASLTATVLDSAGTVIERKDIPTKCRHHIAAFFASHGPDVQVAVESVGFYHWFWDTVKPAVRKIHLALTRRHLRWTGLKNNLPGPATFTSDRAQKWLLTQEPKLSAVHRLSSRQFVDQIATLERQLADVEKVLADTVAAHADLAPTLALIQSVPGIGFITAITILCECGDITRFDTIDQLSAYAGLCPRVTQSGESAHHGHISKQGPPLAQANG